MVGGGPPFSSARGVLGPKREDWRRRRRRHFMKRKKAPARRAMKPFGGLVFLVG